jgi:hypothetical protein
MPSSAKRCCQRQPASRPACTHPPGNIENGKPVRRVKNDPRPLNMIQRKAAVTDDRREAVAVFGSEEHARCLSHRARLACPAADVNPWNASTH